MVSLFRVFQQQRTQREQRVWQHTYNSACDELVNTKKYSLGNSESAPFMMFYLSKMFLTSCNDKIFSLNANCINDPNLALHVGDLGFKLPCFSFCIFAFAGCSFLMHVLTAETVKDGSSFTSLCVFTSWSQCSCLTQLHLQ